MLRRAMFIGAMFIGTMFALAMCLGTFGQPVSTAYAQACDPSGSVDGAAQPSTVLPGMTVTFTATNFTANEEVSFWFTLPNGVVAGTARPLCCAGPDGVVRFAPEPLPNEFYQFPGKWALTVQGATSNHTSVIYFCVVTQAQPTATAVPPTPAPPTATSPPAATVTGAVETPTAAVTAGPTETAAAGTPTTAVETPAPAVTEVPVETSTPVVVGMPITGQGQSDLTFLVLIGLMSLVLLGLGLGVRRTVDR